MSKTYKFDRYVKDAKAEPFVLQISDDETIEIAAPDGETMIEIEESASSRRTLELLTDKHFDRVWDLVRHAPVGVLNQLANDMADHFGLNPQPPGGFTKSSR